MKRYPNTSLALLSLSALIGLGRGYNMIMHPEGDNILFPYPKEIIGYSVFSNFAVLGWVLFVLVGLFSLMVMMVIHWRARNYGYLILVEGIFLSFFSVSHMMLGGFVWIHAFMLVLCVAIIAIGILQTPRDF